MDKKITGILSYLSIVLWLVAYLAGDKENAKFHLNQGLVLNLAAIIISVASGVLGLIPYVGWIFSIVCSLASIAIFVFAIVGIIGASKDEEKPLPIFGTIQILK